MKDIVIVGAGKIGSMIAELLGGSGDYSVTVVDRSQHQLDRLETAAPIAKIAADITQGDSLAQYPDRQVRRAERRALSRHPAHRRGGQGGRRPLPGSDRGRRQHPRGEAARRRRPHRLHSAMRIGAGLHHHRGERPGLALRRVARRAHARRRAAEVPVQCAQLQSDLEHGRRHQRVLRTLRGHRQRPSCAKHSRSRNWKNSPSTAFCTRHSTPRAASALFAKPSPARCAISITAPSVIPATRPS